MALSGIILIVFGEQICVRREMRDGLKAVATSGNAGVSASSSRLPRRRRDSGATRSPTQRRKSTLEMFDANGDLTEGATTLDDDDTDIDDDDEDDLPLVPGKDSAAEHIELMERGRASPSHTPRI